MGKSKKASAEIADMVNDIYPELRTLNWSKLIGYDSEVMTDMLGDVLRVDGKTSRPGKRPSLSREEAEEQFSKISAEDYSDQPFKWAFVGLTHGRSVRNVAHKCDISVTQAQRLKSGNMHPSLELMEKIAAGFKKDPTFFLEYRVALVLAAFNRFLTESPETATNWFLKLRAK